MFLQHPFAKAVSVTTLCGFALASADERRDDPDTPTEDPGGAYLDARTDDPAMEGSRGSNASSANDERSRANAKDSPKTVRTSGAAKGAAGANPRPAPRAPSARSVVIGASPGPAGECSAGMVLIEGEHCPEVEHVCLKWLDPPPYQNLRCAEYEKPAKCKVAFEHRRFCIDREEYAEPASTSAVSQNTGDARSTQDALPMVNKSWLEAKAICTSRGARLCKESEWEFACEGPAMNPYPYGFKRDSNACNIDRTDLGGPNSKLIDHRAPLSAFPKCVSAFDVHDMTGNVDEWVERERQAAPNRSALRGGWWLPGRNRCRAATLGHAESYTAKQVGFRCCADVEASP